MWFHCGILVYERVPYVRGFSGNCPPPTQKNTKLRNWVFFVFLRTSRIFSKIHNFAQISSTTLYPLTYQIVVLTGPRGCFHPCTSRSAPLLFHVDVDNSRRFLTWMWTIPSLLPPPLLPLIIHKNLAIYTNLVLNLAEIHKNDTATPVCTVPGPGTLCADVDNSALLPIQYQAPSTFRRPMV